MPPPRRRGKRKEKQRWLIGYDYIGHLIDTLKVASRQDRFSMRKFKLIIEES